MGILKTSHGEIETPAFVPVATQAVIKTLASEEAQAAKCQILICNTFHLHLKPGEKIVKKSNGLHKFMNWQKPLMTDSGGFQVFSLGFGRDLGVGKIIKRDDNADKKIISVGHRPTSVKITSQIVYFQSPIDGKKLFLGPKESIKIQQDLGADIIFAFDECPPPNADYGYNKLAMERTHRWAIASLKIKNQISKIKNKQAIFGIVQGGKFKDLRSESAKFISSLPFDGFGIGGEFGDDKKKMMRIIDWTIKNLPENKPRHLLGIGHPEDIPKIIKAGVDLFDCVATTQYARRGIAFTSDGKKIDLAKAEFLNDKNPIDKKCGCFVCQNYRRNYISHLLRAKEITPLKLLTFHNLYFFNSFVENIRKKIRQGLTF